jgi:heat shock protein HslJ
MRRIPLCLALAALLATVAPVHATEQAEQSDTPTTDSPAAIANADGGLLQILQDHQWSLKSATDGQSQAIATLLPADAPPYVFTFSAANLNFQGGCNTFGGAYQINAQGQLQAGQIQSTMMACEPALMQADAALAALLAQPLQITIMWAAPPQLQLRTAAAETLVLEGRVTPEAVYGPSTLIFLEVDARQLPCRNPRNTQTTCLQVREISFDEQGLRSAISGPWQPFYDEIEGYTHIPGQRNVLRVKRFDRDAASGNAAPAVFVLDLIVETEIVPQGEAQAAPQE